jgi:hypothetical protein
MKSQNQEEEEDYTRGGKRKTDRWIAIDRLMDSYR